MSVSKLLQEKYKAVLITANNVLIRPHVIYAITVIICKELILVSNARLVALVVLMRLFALHATMDMLLAVQNAFLAQIVAKHAIF